MKRGDEYRIAGCACACRRRAGSPKRRWGVAGAQGGVEKSDSKEVASYEVIEAAAREGKYLTFSLAGEEYGIVIRKVKPSVWLAVSGRDT
jgi:hypothetical protein